MKVTHNTAAKKAARAKEAQELRDALIDADIEVFGVYWQVAAKDRDNINETIAYAERNNLPAEMQQAWILADNSIRMTTADELKAVLSARVERMGNIFAAYTAWRAGGMREPFRPELV